MAWLSNNSFTSGALITHTMFNNLANDIRNWGGNVNAGGYSLSNIGSLMFPNGDVITGIAAFQTPWKSNIAGAGFSLSGVSAIATTGNVDSAGGGFHSTVGGVSARMMSGGGVAYYGSITAHPTAFMSGGGERMRLSAAGNFGIGTIDPTYPVHMVTAGPYTIKVEHAWNTLVTFGNASIILKNTNGAVGTSTAIMNENSGGGSNAEVRFYNGPGTGVYPNNGGSIGFNTYDGAGSGGMERMRIGPSIIGVYTTLSVADSATSLGTMTVNMATGLGALPVHINRPTGQCGIILQTGLSSGPYSYVDYREGGGTLFRVGFMGSADYSIADETSGNRLVYSKLTGNLYVDQMAQSATSYFMVVNRGSSVAGSGVRLRLGPHTGYKTTPAVCPYVESLAEAGGAGLQFGVNLGVGIAEAMRIAPSGRLGIGTTAPLFRLHVSGAGTQQTEYLTPESNVDNGLCVTDNVFDVGRGGALYFGAADSRFAALRGDFINGSNYGIGFLGFFVRSVGTSNFLTRVMRLDPDGSVQIPYMPTVNPGAGTKKMWADPADGYRIKWAV